MKVFASFFVRYRKHYRTFFGKKRYYTDFFITNGVFDLVASPTTKAQVDAFEQIMLENVKAAVKDEEKLDARYCTLIDWKKVDD